MLCLKIDWDRTFGLIYEINSIYTNKTVGYV